MSVQSEARDLLWGAVPPQLGDNRKSWLARAARVLDWNPRRVRAVWNGEARVIKVEEMRQLEARFEAQQQRSAQRQEQRDALRALLQRPISPVSVAQRVGDDATGSEASRSRPVGGSQGDGFLND